MSNSHETIPTFIPCPKHKSFLKQPMNNITLFPIIFKANKEIIKPNCALEIRIKLLYQNCFYICYNCLAINARIYCAGALARAPSN